MDILFLSNLLYLSKDGTSHGDTSNLPRVTQNAPEVTDFPDVMNYAWEKIFSSNSSNNLPSIYLVTTHMRGEMGFLVEKVLFLVIYIMIEFFSERIFNVTSFKKKNIY